MATVLDVFKAARTHLDDDDAAVWTDPRLMPKLQVAFRELQVKLQINGAPVLFQTTATLTVPANTSDLTLLGSYPTDIVEPISVYERDPGQAVRDFAEMTESDFPPLIDPANNIHYWAWIGEHLLVSPSTQISEVLIRYTKSLTTPTAVNDPIGIQFGDLYLGYRVAALAVASPTGNKIYGMRTMQLDSFANKFLEQIVTNVTRHAQNLPAKRRGYHRSRYYFNMWVGN